MTVIYYVEVNLICIVVLGIMYYSMLKAKNDISDFLFKGLLLTTMLMCLSDMIAGVFRGSMVAGARAIIWSSNLGYFISSFAISVFWVLYSMNALSGKINKEIMMATIVMASALSLLFISTIFHGLIFTVDQNNLYKRGPLNWLNWVFLLPSLIFPSIIAPFTKAEKREKYAVASFAILPFIATLTQAFVYGITVCQAGTTASLLMIYVMLQSKRIIEAESQVMMLSEITNTDTLTGLKNRRAFDLEIKELKNSEWVGVVFADLNGLKRMNDAKGHDAGDAMIIRFAEFLKVYFDEDSIYRISGDEFIVFSTDKNDHYKKYETMLRAVGDTAAVGFAEGKGPDVRNILAQAEKNMYANKSEYYIRSGLNRRR